MTIHEFGQGNGDVVVLIHPSLVMWDYFEYVIPLMQDRCHLVIPALPGHDPDDTTDFTSVEQIAAELADWLTAQGHSEIACLYGCSMGGSIVARFLADGRVKVRSAVIDGGITPYPLPWIVTRLIAVRDFLLIYMGKAGGLKVLEKAFSTDAYSEEDLQYIAKVLKHASAKTIMRCRIPSRRIAITSNTGTRRRKRRPGKPTSPISGSACPRPSSRCLRTSVTAGWRH